MDIIESIKIKMRHDKVTAEELGNKCGISKYTVINILQKKSKRIDYISKIANILNITLDNPEYNLENHAIIQLEQYFSSTTIVESIITKKALTITKEKLEEFIYSVYKYIIINPSEEKLAIAYAEGLVQKYANN